MNRAMVILFGRDETFFADRDIKPPKGFAPMGRVFPVPRHAEDARVRYRRWGDWHMTGNGKDWRIEFPEDR